MASGKLPVVHFIKAASGDWIAMYVNGKKAAEGHSLDEVQVIEALGLKVTSVEIGDEEAENGGFPEALPQRA